MDFFSDIVDSISGLLDDSSSKENNDDNDLLEYYFESVPIMGGTEGVESMYGVGEDDSSTDNSSEPETNV